MLIWKKIHFINSVINHLYFIFYFLKQFFIFLFFQGVFFNVEGDCIYIFLNIDIKTINLLYIILIKKVNYFFNKMIIVYLFYLLYILLFYFCIMKKRNIN